MVGARTYRALADLTGQNSETVRRYMQGAAPSTEFLAALCNRMDLNAHWLLTGQGPMRQSDTRAHALREANPSELLAAIAVALEELTRRVDRLETHLNTIETRLRGHRLLQEGAAESPTHPTHGEETNEPQAAAHTPGFAGPAGSDAPGEGVRVRAGSIADAVAKRSRPDAG